MAPHNVYPAAGEDRWVAIACRDDHDWEVLAGTIAEPWVDAPHFANLAGRIEHEDELDVAIGAWTAGRDRFAVAGQLRAAGVPAAVVTLPEERIDHDANTAAWELWPTVHHCVMGEVRVDGLPVHFSETDWSIEHGGPCLGEHNERILGGLLGCTEDELADLAAEGVI